MTEDAGEGGGAQRLDKWLWCARFFKSRNLAHTLLAAGRLRDVLNGPDGPLRRRLEDLAGAVVDRTIDPMTAAERLTDRLT